MTREHDTSDRPPRQGEPSPFAPGEGGALGTSPPAPPADRRRKRMPPPFSQPSSFIYPPRDRVWVAFMGEALDSVNVIRDDALDRRLVHAHGRARALSIARGEDGGAAGDLAKWQAFGG